MKKLRLIFPIAIVVMVQACNNNASTDSVAKADSLNSAKDTTGTMAAKDSSVANGVNGNVATFLVNAINGNLLEVNMGKYAASHASSKTVRQFAEMAVKVHEGFDAEIRTFAKGKNISLPDSTSDKNMDKMDDIMKKTGKDFDKAYMNKVVSDHKKDMDMFQHASDNLKDASVKSFASNSVSEIQKHLSEAEAIVKTNNY